MTPQRYFVEIRNAEHWRDAELTGYLCDDGRLIVEFDRDFPRGTPLKAASLDPDAIVVVSYDQRGRLRSVEERKHIAAIAERHGFKVARGARANLQPIDFRRLRPPPGPCPHERIQWNDVDRRWPYKCRSCRETFREDQVVIADGQLQHIMHARTWRAPSMSATLPNSRPIDDAGGEQHQAPG